MGMGAEIWLISSTGHLCLEKEVQGRSVALQPSLQKCSVKGIFTSSMASVEVSGLGLSQCHAARNYLTWLAADEAWQSCFILLEFGVRSFISSCACGVS